jgi:hypothetical protein
LNNTLLKAFSKHYNKAAIKFQGDILCIAHVLNLVILSQNTNDQGRFIKVKTRLTTKRKRECKKRGDYIYVARG